MFFGGEDLYPCDMCTQVIFFSEALWDPKVGFVVVPVEARLLITLGVRSVSFGLSIVVPIYSCVYVEDV